MSELKQKKRQKVLIIILIIAVIVTGITWYLNRPKTSPATKLISGEKGSSGFSITEERLAEIKLDFSIFEDPLFKSLKSHGLLPVTVDQAGRENPFEAY